MSDVSEEEVAQCVATLRKLTPGTVEAYPELHSAGMDLWRRSVIKERYGEADVVAFMREATQHKEMLKRLERLQVAVHRAHEERVLEAAGCEINTRRGDEMLRIGAEQGEAAEAKAVAGATLLGFEGLKDENGDVIPMTSKQRHMLKMDRQTAESKRAYTLKMEEERSVLQLGSCNAALAAPDAGPDAAPMSWVTCREWKRAESTRTTDAADERDAAARLAAVAAIPVGFLR